jgi:hypothetical protein
MDINTLRGLTYFAIIFFVFLAGPVQASSCNANERPSILPYSFSNTFDSILAIEESGSIAGGATGPAYQNIDFESGVDGQAVIIGNNSALSFSTDHRLNALSGKISFWFKPTWNGNAIGHTRMLFDATPFRIFIYKGSTRNYFVFRYDDLAGNQREVSTSASEPDGGGDGTVGIVSAWKAGEWHHVEVSWDLTKAAGRQTLSYTLDGTYSRTLSSTWNGVQALPCEFYLSASNSTQKPDGSFDALEIDDPIGLSVTATQTLHAPLQSDDSVNQSSGTTHGGGAYAAGVVGEGVLTTAGSYVSFPTVDHIDKLKGTISFNFKPNWNGNETNVSHYFIDAGSLRVFTYRGGSDSKNYFVFRFDDASGAQQEVSTSSLEPAGGGDGSKGVVSAWKAGEWHRIEVFWDLTGASGSQYMSFVIDGVPYTSRTATWNGVAELDTGFTLGASRSGSTSADGEIDELVIYNESAFDTSDPINSYERITRGDGIWQAHETIYNSPQDAHKLSDTIESGNNYIWFGKANFSPVYEGTVPQESELTTTFATTVAQNETETVFVNLYSRTTLGDAEISVTTPTNDEGETLSGTKIYLVKNWWQAGSTPLKSTFPVYTPELLISSDVSGDGAKLSSLDAIRAADWKAGNLPSLPYLGVVHTRFDSYTSRQIAIVVKVPTGAKGAYHATLSLKDSTGALLSTAHLQVDAEDYVLLPPNKNFLIYHRATINAPTSNDNVSLDVYTKELQDIADHGLTGLMMYGSNVDNLRKQFNVIQNIGWNGRVIADSESEGIRDLLVEFGQVPYFYGVDEPNDEAKIVNHINLSYKIHNLGDQPGEVHGKVITAITHDWAGKLRDPNDPIYSLSGINAGTPPYEPLDSANLSLGSSLDYIQGLIDGTATRDNYLQTYYWQSMQENPSINRSYTGFYLWNTGLDGVFPYVYEHISGNPYDDFDVWSSTTSYRDHLTTYPSVEGPVDTVQWEAFREGIDDYRYLETWKYYRDIVSTYDPDFAAHSTATINNVLTSFSQYKNLAGLGATQFAEARAQIQSEIRSLRARN